LITQEAGMADNYSDAMLRHIIDEARRALSIPDPAGRADIISSVLQPYTGWALRWAIEDCRARGLTWQAIAGMLGRSYPALLRQYETGGPVYTVTPAHSPNSGNFDGQTPLRRAAFALRQQIAGLANTRPDCMTYAHLAEASGNLTAALANTDDPAPLLRATYEMLAIAGRIRIHVPTPMPKLERETWATIDELRACYDRDRTEIETAHQVISQVAALERPLADAPVFTRPLRARTS
jgi:hypothetical protein